MESSFWSRSLPSQHSSCATSIRSTSGPERWRPELVRIARALVIIPYFILATLPLGWLALTSFKSYDDTISTEAKVMPGAEFTPSLDAYRSLSKPVAGTARDFYHYLGNSIIIAVLST